MELEARRDGERSLLDAMLEEYFAHYRLSAQQKRVLRFYLRGACDKEIAASLGCAPATVIEHWRRIVEKTACAYKAGIVGNLIAFLREHEHMRAPASRAASCPHLGDSPNLGNSDRDGGGRGSAPPLP